METRHCFRPHLRKKLWVPAVTSIVMLSLVGSVLWCQPYVQKPIPTGAKAKLWTSWTPIYRKFYQREIVEAYRKNGVHSPKWDADAVKFLDHFTKLVFVDGYPTDTKSFYEEGKALIDAGCNDPMVLYAYGVMLFEGGRQLDAQAPLSAASKASRTAPITNARQDLLRWTWRRSAITRNR